MKVMIELIASFILVSAFGVIFQAPKRSLWLVGLTGSISWSGFLVADYFIDSIVISSFIASIVVSLCGELFARIMKLPITVFVIAGIIPLVPGVPAYNTMLFIIQGDYLQGLELGINTLMIAGAIAFAIAIVGAGAKYYKDFLQNNRAR